MAKCLGFLLSLLLCVSTARAADGGGDIYVAVDNGGGLIFLDGSPTSIVAPGVLQGVSAGKHSVRVDDRCRTGTADVTVRVNAVERANIRMEVGTGTVRVESTPAETRVTEDGKELGVGSFGPISMSCGTHILVGTAPGRQPTPYTVEVPLHGHVDAPLVLPHAALGSVAVTPTPLDAEVFVDGVSKGKGPMTIDALPPGTHIVTARKDGYVTARHDVTVVANEIVRSTIALSAKARFRADWPRIGVNIGLSVATVGLATVAFLEYDRATDNYDTYTGLTYADDPAGYYASDVQGPMTTAWILAGSSGATAITSGVLWATTRPRPEPTPSTSAVQPAAPQLLLGPAPYGMSLSGRF